MNEIYWITRLESINIVLTTCVVILSVIIGISSIIWLVTANDSFEVKTHDTCSGILKRFFPVLIVSTLLLVFTPTTKDAIMIWGIGGTIDYIKSNDTAKKLPDKCIQALDKFVDEYMLDINNNKENAKD